MKVCEIDRNFMYTMLMHSLQALEIWPFAIEQGRCKGNNIHRLLKNLNHEPPVLLVSCSTATTHAYSPFDPQPDWIYPPEAYDFNCGSPSWDRLCERYRKSFITQPTVHIVRASIAEALPAVRALACGSGDDLIDVDSSHQHEDMLRDLMFNQALVGPQGAFMLNDCCHSEAYHWRLANSDVAFFDVASQLFPAARLVRGDQRDHLTFV